MNWESIINSIQIRGYLNPGDNMDNFNENRHTMISIADYLYREIGKNAQKKNKIPQILNEINEKTQNNTLGLVRGDGNCLTRAIICYMRKHTPQIFVNIAISLFQLCNRDIIIPDTDKYDDLIVIMIRELISKLWDYKESSIYHMDDNAIDGDAIRMVMRLLGLNMLHIYQAFDGADRKQGWRTIILNDSERFFHDHTHGISVFLFTLNGCHYSTII